MKILIAPDSFKGTMSSERVITLVGEQALRVFPGVALVKVPIADGGEGTVAALVSAVGGEYKTASVTGPMGNIVEASYGFLPSGAAVMEMAQTSGLTLVDAKAKDPLKATSRGTGELIKKLLDDGARDIIIGIGGSATNDGGMGALTALGVKFYDAKGALLDGRGEDLEKVARVDVGGLDKRIKDTAITVICDVSNPLTGESGATFIYGPQKGAVGEVKTCLERGMCVYRDAVNDQLGVSTDTISGAGAAGGMGYALITFLGAKLKPGIQAVLDAVNFDEMIKDVDLVITGEGNIDGQSVRFGKVPTGILRRCAPMGVPVIIIAGGMGEGAEDIFKIGPSSIITTINAAMPIKTALKNAETLLSGAALRALRFIEMGMLIAKGRG